MKLILDTNVIVSGLITRVRDAPPRVLLDALVDGRFESVTSPELMAEWREVACRPRVRAYARLDEAGVDLAIGRVVTLSELLDPPPADTPAPDPNDAHVWALLAADPATVLVTGDGPLLGAPFGPGRVITPRDAVERLQREGRAGHGSE